MADGRTNNGGRRPNSGRKSKAEEAELKRLLDRNWPKKKRAEMIRAWGERAAQGDLEAGKLLMDRAYGKATEHIRHSSDDARELKEVYENLVERILERASKLGEEVSREQAVNRIIRRKPEAKEYLM